MARIRTIKPTIWTDDAFIELSHEARLLCIGMISQADDEGRVIASPSALIGTIYPHDNVQPKQVERWRDEVAASGMVVVYQAGRATYAAFPKWHSHQVINKRTRSTLPPPSLPSNYGTTPVATPVVTPVAAPLPLPTGSGSGSGSGSGTTTPPQAARASDPVDALFETWWQVYPRHEAKAAARKAYAKAVRYVDPERIMAGTVRYRDDPNRTPEFTPHPASWLNAGRWDDEPLPGRPGLRAVAGNPSNPNKEW